MHYIINTLFPLKLLEYLRSPPVFFLVPKIYSWGSSFLESVTGLPYVLDLWGSRHINRLLNSHFLLLSANLSPQEAHRLLMATSLAHHLRGNHTLDSNRALAGNKSEQGTCRLLHLIWGIVRGCSHVYTAFSRVGSYLSCAFVISSISGSSLYPQSKYLVGT